MIEALMIEVWGKNAWGEVLWRVQCPYCNGTHIHGENEGRRVADCNGKIYYIVRNFSA